MSKCLLLGWVEVYTCKFIDLSVLLLNIVKYEWGMYSFGCSSPKVFICVVVISSSTYVWSACLKVCSFAGTELWVFIHLKEDTCPILLLLGSIALDIRISRLYRCVRPKGLIDVSTVSKLTYNVGSFIRCSLTHLGFTCLARFAHSHRGFAHKWAHWQ